MYKFNVELEVDSFIQVDGEYYEQAAHPRASSDGICCGEHSFIKFVRQELAEYDKESKKFAVDMFTGIHANELHGKELPPARELAL